MNNLEKINLICFQCYMKFLNTIIQLEVREAQTEEELEMLYKKTIGKRGLLKKIEQMIFIEGNINYSEIINLIEESFPYLRNKII